MKDYINCITEELYSSDGLNRIEHEIWSLYISIVNTNALLQAIPFFEKLACVHFVLAKAVFKDKLTITPFLVKFMSDFDRIDDDQVKEDYYNNYPFAQ